MNEYNEIDLLNGEWRMEKAEKAAKSHHIMLSLKHAWLAAGCWLLAAGMHLIECYGPYSLENQFLLVDNCFSQLVLFNNSFPNWPSLRFQNQITESADVLYINIFSLSSKTPSGCVYTLHLFIGRFPQLSKHFQGPLLSTDAIGRDHHQ